MCAKPKKMMRHAALAAPCVLVALTMIGCAGSSQSRRDVPDWQWRELEQQRSELMTNSGNTGAVIFAPGAEVAPSWYAYERDLAPEYARRDTALAVGEPDPTAGWYAWPEQQRPSLDDQEYFHTSRNANVYSYPGTDGHRHRSYHDRRDRRSSPYPRRRVR